MTMLILLRGYNMTYIHYIHYYYLCATNSHIYYVVGISYVPSILIQIEIN